MTSALQLQFARYIERDSAKAGTYKPPRADVGNTCPISIILSQVTASSLSTVSGHVHFDS